MAFGMQADNGIFVARSDDPGAPGAPVDAMIAKYHAATAAFRGANDVLQLHGAAGLDPAHPAQELWRDARVMEIIEGSTEVLQSEISRAAPGLID